MTTTQLKAYAPPPYEAHDNTRHPLPVSNGYGVIRGQIVVECRRCKSDRSGLWAADRDWAERYLAMKERSVKGRIGKGGDWGLTEDEARIYLDDKRALLARLLDGDDE
jgi:hypothetical protein